LNSWHLHYLQLHRLLT